MLVKAGVHLHLNPPVTSLNHTWPFSICCSLTFTLDILIFSRNHLIYQRQTEFCLRQVLLYSNSLKICNYLHVAAWVHRTMNNPEHFSQPGEQGLCFHLSSLASSSTSTRGQSGESFTSVRTPLLRTSFNLWIKRWFLVLLKAKSKIKYQIYYVTLLYIYIIDFWLYIT